MGVVGWGDVAARTLLAAYMVWRCARPRPCASLGIPSTRSLRRGRRGPKHAYTRTCTRAPGQPHTPRAGAWGGRMCHQQARKRAGPRRPSDGVSAMPKDHKTAGAGERTGGSGRRRARACGCVRVPSGRVCRRALLKYTRTPPHTHTRPTHARTRACAPARASSLRTMSLCMSWRGRAHRAFQPLQGAPHARKQGRITFVRPRRAHASARARPRQLLLSNYCNGRERAHALAAGPPSPPGHMHHTRAMSSMCVRRRSAHKRTRLLAPAD